MRIRSTSMPQFRKNKWLEVFLDLVWKNNIVDNLSCNERKAIKELRNAGEIVIKQSDKEGNVVLISVDMYEKEVRRLLSDESTYRKLDYNPFKPLVKLINDRL